MGIGSIAGGGAQPIALPQQTEALLAALANNQAQATEVAAMLAGGGGLPGNPGLGQIVDIAA